MLPERSLNTGSGRCGVVIGRNDSAFGGWRGDREAGLARAERLRTIGLVPRPNLPRLTVAEYLELERSSEQKHGVARRALHA